MSGPTTCFDVGVVNVNGQPQLCTGYSMIEQSQMVVNVNGQPQLCTGYSMIIQSQMVVNVNGQPQLCTGYSMIIQSRDRVMSGPTTCFDVGVRAE